MSAFLRTVSVVVIAITLAMFLAWLLIVDRGFTARGDPSKLETWFARGARRLAIPTDIASLENPLPPSPAVLLEALAHFADHCASCHANDGSGDTETGRNLYPPAPDMRLGATQSLSDGELFYLIHNGVPLTGMPAWGDGDFSSDRESWKLVRFIRHLPEITREELARMRELNPKSAHEAEEEQAAREFLSGRGALPRDGVPDAHAH